MLEDDVNFYLREFRRVLCLTGKIYLTAFIEEDVPAMIENPKDYLGGSKGPLHRVRYSRKFFYELVREAGLTVCDYRHHMIDRTGQSVVVLKYG